MRCTIEASKLDKRGQEITKLLGPIAPKGQRLACWKRLLNRQVVFSAYLGPQPTDAEPDLWRFATKISRIRASYHERWLQTDFRQQAFYLERAYLHLYLRSNLNDEREILALHCDPNEAQTERHFLYKVGPHVRKRSVFPSGIPAGSSLTMWSWFRQKERVVAFADFVRLPRSVGLSS
jgi:hypothetical protein